MQGNYYWQKLKDGGDGWHSFKATEELTAETAILQSLKKTLLIKEIPYNQKWPTLHLSLGKNERRTWGILGPIHPSKDCEACPFGIHLQTHESNQE